MTQAPPLAVTMGDPAGIGAEITLKALASGQLRHRIVLIHDPGQLEALAGPLGISVRAIETPDALSALDPRDLGVLAISLAAPVSLGTSEPRNAQAVINAIETAVRLTQSGATSGVVTNPINKKTLYDGAGFAFPGHTEFLAALGGVERSVMMLAGPKLKVVPVTIHIPLTQIANELTVDLIIETVTITAHALQQDFGLSNPRIAVSGLNPHAGEGGAMGREEIDIIAPAINVLKANDLTIFGPLPADTMFHDRARAGYDVAITMYHDQGLIPIKALDFDRGVNVTLGLPFIRTSPDHGTAYDIAGKNLADPTSMIEAINLAGDMAAARRQVAPR